MIQYKSEGTIRCLFPDIGLLPQNLARYTIHNVDTPEQARSRKRFWTPVEGLQPLTGLGYRLVLVEDGLDLALERPSFGGSYP